METTIEELYKRCGVLADAKDKAGEHPEEYKFILQSVKGGSNEKRLASQFIARFFKFFPNMGEQSLDAMFDLCEDEDVNIRKQAIKDLPALVKEAADYLPRVADVLAQLLQTEDQNEISLVHMSLMALMRINAKGTLSGLFGQILQGEELVRERAINFLSAKIKILPETILTRELEDYIVAEIKKIVQDVTGDEFMTFMSLLSGLQTMQTMMGRQGLLEIVTEQADLNTAFEAENPDCTDRLVQCVKQAMPLFSKNVHSDKFAAYMCEQVLPHLSSLSSHTTAAAAAANGQQNGASGDTKPDNHDIQLEVLKLLAEMSAYCGPMEGKLDTSLQCVYDKLTEYMPLPPADAKLEESETEEPKLQFSYVECLMFTFHQLARKQPTFLTDEANAERLKDFRIRLQYFARGVQVYIRQLRVALQGKTGDALKSDENKIKVVALKITNNINTLIKDLMHNPPSYKAVVGLSFRPLAAQAKAAEKPKEEAGTKRPGYKAITYDSGPTGAKRPFKPGPREIYSPPGGKFSQKAGSYNPGGRGGRGRGRGRGRGGFRGRQW